MAMPRSRFCHPPCVLNHVTERCFGQATPTNALQIAHDAQVRQGERDAHQRGCMDNTTSNVQVKQGSDLSGKELDRWATRLSDDDLLRSDERKPTQSVRLKQRMRELPVIAPEQANAVSPLGVIPPHLGA